MRRALAVLVLLLLVAGLASVGAQEGAPAKPDVIVILLDDMRASDWAALPETRRLLSDGGAWYENFVLTTPQCCPSRATLLTGRYAHNHRTLNNEGKQGGWAAFRAAGNEDRTLAVAVDAAGYRTALVGKYLNGWPADRAAPPGWDVWHGSESGGPYINKDGSYSTDRQRDEALAFLADGAPGEPSFLWFAPAAPHNPATPAKRHRDAFPDEPNDLNRRRLQTLLAVDEAVVAIDGALGPERSRAALWLVLSDNGYLFGKRTGKAVPHDGAVRVPMLVRGPGIAPGDDPRLAASIDIAPTIARTAGVDLPAEPDGRPLQDAWDRERVLIEGWDREGSHAYGPFAGVRTACQTYVERSGGGRFLLDRCRGGGERRVDLDRSAAGWARTLDALRACVGQACREADGS